MSTPKYFQNFPNIEYATSIDKAGRPSFITIKDYFHLLTVRPDIFREETLYTRYVIQNGERPDQVSYKFYGDEQYYWILLQINEITDYYTEWPLSETELTEFVNKKYGGFVGAEKIHHYQTVETYDKSTPPNRVLPGGLTVPENYKFTYPDTPGSDIFLTSFPIAVTNYDYERQVNELKSEIFILDKKYIYNYQREVNNYARNLEPSVSFVTSEQNTTGPTPTSDATRYPQVS
tara:strand:+ start:8417 stop:9115 length:699 start_codon:yes stop_codon:yes gene_type:complete